MSARAFCALVTLGVLAPVFADAQTWRTVEMSRQLRDSAAHEISVNYAGGRFTLLSGRAGLLYDARIRYDEQRGIPEVGYDREARQLSFNLELEEESNPGKSSFGEMRLALAPSIPIELDLELGAVEADIALGGLAITGLRVDAGASSSRVTFDAPNPVAMEGLDLHAGAASLTATGLANANAAEMRVAAGVGNVDLDFGGRWTRNIDATVDIALGRARVQVPPDVGIRVEMSRVLARFQHPDLVKQGDAWVSENWDSAQYHLTLRMNTTFGSVEIVRGRD
jgi:hypothetical protein